MVCSSGVGFDPTVDGTRYTFDVFGLYNGLFVMSDRQTGSVWTHYDGTVLLGPLAGDDIAMPIEPMVHTSWENWTEAHPDTLVLDWYQEFASQYRDVDIGRAGKGRVFTQSVANFDDRLPENELVLGAGVGLDYRAYVLADTGSELAVINDHLGGQPVVVFVDAATVFGLAFSAVVDGEARTFSVADGQIVDDTGAAWTIEGTPVEGTDDDPSLDFVTSFVTEWYGWSPTTPTPVSTEPRRSVAPAVGGAHGLDVGLEPGDFAAFGLGLDLGRHLVAGRLRQRPPERRMGAGAGRGLDQESVDRSDLGPDLVVGRPALGATGRQDRLGGGQERGPQTARPRRRRETEVVVDLDEHRRQAVSVVGVGVVGRDHRLDLMPEVHRGLGSVRVPVAAVDDLDEPAPAASADPPGR